MAVKAPEQRDLPRSERADGTSSTGTESTAERPADWTHPSKPAKPAMTKAAAARKAMAVDLAPMRSQRLPAM